MANQVDLRLVTLLCELVRRERPSWAAYLFAALALHVHGDVAVRERVRAYRARMRAQGLRPVQIWVPDVPSPEFAAEAHRQSQLVAAVDRASDDMDFVEAVSADWDE